MAALEGGVAAVAVASGQAAQMITIMNIMKSGDNFVTSPYLYGGTYNQFFVSFKDLGIEARKAASDKAEDMEKLIDANTKALYTENIGNPYFNVPDFEKLTNKTAGVKVVYNRTQRYCKTWFKDSAVIVEVFKM